MSSRASLTIPLAAPSVRADIVKVLRRRGVPRDDLHDLVQETLTRALAVRNAPRDLAECTRLTRVIARNVATDHVRRQAVRRRYDANVRPEDQPARGDAFALARDPVDGRRQLELVLHEAESGALSPRALAIVHAVSERVPQTKIAEELGLAHPTVRNELCRARRRFRAKWDVVERKRAPSIAV